MNLTQIKNQNNRAITKYTTFGARLFRKALLAQAKEFDERIMIEAYIEFYQYVFSDAAKRAYYQIRALEKTKDFAMSDFFLSTWRNWIGQWVKDNLGQHIQNVNDTTRGIINDVLAEASELGLNPFQTEKQLSKIVGSRSRARAIAITEGTKANNMGQKRSGEDYAAVTGLTLYKVFIHSGNPREPRLSHIMAQGKPIPKDEPFNIEGILLDTPGNPIPGQDRKNVARQVINCGCTVSYISERFARKRFPDAFE
jgi:hypothetical protein